MRSPYHDDDRDGRARGDAEDDSAAFAARWGPEPAGGRWRDEADEDEDERYHGRRRALLGSAGRRRTVLIAACSLLATVLLGTAIALTTSPAGIGVTWRRVEAAGSGLPTGDASPTVSGSPQATPSGAATPRASQSSGGTVAPFTPVTYEAEAGAPAVMLAGSAQVAQSARASGGQIVSGLGNSGAATPGVLSINGLIIPSADTYRIAIYFVNIGKPSVRTAVVTVSGAAALTVSFSGAHNCCGVRFVEVNLDAGVHAITIANPDGAAPSIDRIVVSRAVSV